MVLNFFGQSNFIIKNHLFSSSNGYLPLENALQFIGRDISALLAFQFFFFFVVRVAVQRDIEHEN